MGYRLPPKGVSFRLAKLFECDIDETGLKIIRAYCKENLDLETDSVRIYKICNRCINKVIISGLGLKVTQLDYLVV